MKRSILAIFVGFILESVVFCIFMPAAKTEGLSALAPLICTLGMAFGGYLAALIAQRAPIAHSLVLAVVSFVFWLFLNRSMGVHQSLQDLVSAIVGPVLLFTWGGLFRSWQMSHSVVAG